jgi:hypothetical protein
MRADFYRFFFLLLRSRCGKFRDVVLTLQAVVSIFLLFYVMNSFRLLAFDAIEFCVRVGKHTSDAALNSSSWSLILMKKRNVQTSSYGAKSFSNIL